MREAGKTSEDGLNRVKRYLAARGYLSGAQLGLVSQMELAAGSGENDERRCMEWRINNTQAVLERRDEPQFCNQTDKCGNLSRLPM